MSVARRRLFPPAVSIPSIGAALMSACLLRRSTLTTLAGLTLLAACAEKTSEPRNATSVVRRVKLDPRFELLDPGAPGLIVVCSSDDAATFTVSATPAHGTLAGDGSFSVAAGTCETAWQAD